MIPLLMTCFVVYFVSTNTGFDGSLMSSIYTQEDYLERFQLDVNSSTATGLVFSIYNVGQICAAFFCPLIDLWGRKKMILIGCWGTVVGAIITVVAHNRETLIAGRFFLSFFTTLANTSASLYVTEIANSNNRSIVAGCYNTLWYVGSILAAFTSYGSNIHHGGSERSFRIPLGMQALFPGIVGILGWFIPESPRWLVGVGKEEEGREMIAKFHCNGDRSHPLLDYEMAQIENSFRDNKLATSFKILDMRPIFQDRNTYRSLLVIAMAFFGQFSGNNVCSYYLPTMLINIGMTSTTTNVLMNAIYSIVSWVSSVIGSFAHEKVGRRKMFMFSTLACSLCLTGLAVSTARYQATQAAAASRSALAFIYLFGIMFSFAFTPMQPIYPAEISSNVLRSRSMVVLNVTAGVASFINQFASPQAMKNIGFWFYVFYVFWDIFEFFIVYFFFVETRGKTLEEMDRIFASRNPRKVSVGDYSSEDEVSLQRLHLLSVSNNYARGKVTQENV
ncbi:lactose permease [Scheffersomyces xylosifermentans]|uniref:lactose permease n=1 Tax=Scheffersomyces xylosifermentans TaxID=1304137 RepID=UPI00315D77FF